MTKDNHMTNIDNDETSSLAAPLMEKHWDVLMPLECGISKFEAFMGLVYGLAIEKGSRKDLGLIVPGFIEAIEDWASKNNFLEEKVLNRELFKILKEKNEKHYPVIDQLEHIYHERFNA